jgi:hypothetical protein
MNINLTITATPELTELLLNITGLLSKEAFRSAPMGIGNYKDNREREKDTSPNLEGQADGLADKTEENSKQQVKITLEETRTFLAALSQGGKQPQVKELLSSLGVRKLSQLDPKNYADLLKAAEKI